MMTTDGFYKKEGETSPQYSLARCVNAYSFGDKAFAQRMYDYLSKTDFMTASPVLSNAPEFERPDFTEDQFQEASDWLAANVKVDSQPISCFKPFIPDTKEGLVDSSSEVKWLAMMGGGVGIKMGNRSPDEKSTGVMAHLRGYDADTLAYKQGNTRRGNIAAGLDIDHPEILQFINMRMPTGGDHNKKGFNLHQHVCIPDKFMHKVIKGEDYELVDPKHGPTGVFLNARSVWEELMQTRFEAGEPYLVFVDTINRNLPKQIRNPHYKVVQTNLCVAPETKILTRKGYETISELEGQTLDVWNGEKWSSVDVVKTGENQELLTIETSSGASIDCTEYHKFYVVSNYKGGVVEKRANELNVGDKLIKFDLPVIEGSETLEKAYTNGFFSGDGFKNSKSGHHFIDLYGDKKNLAELIEGAVSWYYYEPSDRLRSRVEGLKDKFFVPNAGYTIKSRLEWLSGLLDSDGCVTRNGENESLQIGNCNKDFLLEVQMMLQSLGVTSKVTLMRGEQYTSLPDGNGGMADYLCRDVFRLLITSNGLFQLSKLGLKSHRLVWSHREPQREASAFIRITAIKDEHLLLH